MKIGSFVRSSAVLAIITVPQVASKKTNLRVGSDVNAILPFGGRQLQSTCSSNLQGADIVILFDESGSMGNEQATAAANTITLFNAFAAVTGSAPRFAVGGFGRADPAGPADELHELTNNFVTNPTALQNALNNLVTNGSFEEGYKALIDTFDPNSGELTWNFQQGNRICAIVFTDEDSDGPETAAQVIAARGSNAIIPVVSNGGTDYSAVSSLPGGATLSLVDFVTNPGPTINTIVSSCVEALSPTAVCQDVTVQHDGSCFADVAAIEFDGGSSDPQGSPLTFSVMPMGPYPIGMTSVTLSVSDPEGNCDTCEAKVTVEGVCTTTTPPPGGGGDPHFWTWSGSSFDYHGQCDLVLVHNPEFDNNLGMDVHVRTRVRYGYSYIESAAIRIGEDVFEVSSFGEYSINGVDEAESPFLLAGKFRVDQDVQVNNKERTFHIHLNEDTEESIFIRTYKDLVNIKFLNASDANFEGSVGLMGTYGNSNLVGRDGETVFEDWNAYGQEWQVGPSEPKLFGVHDNFPQYPEACILPSMPGATSA